VARQKKPEEHGHSESWLVSYCDMISLLVTFFLMMMTFSTKDKYDLKEASLGLLRGRGGIWKNPTAFPQENEIDLLQVEMFAKEVAALTHDANDDQSLSVKTVTDGFSMSFDTACSFGPGSDEITPALHAQLQKVGRVLARYEFTVVVEGYTDTEFKPNAFYSSDVAMGLGRAREAAYVLMDECGVRADRMQVSSVGALRPRASNDTALGRQSNRRVELRVLPSGKRKTPGGVDGQGG
jgi:chemotaxis protein MotB